MPPRATTASKARLSGQAPSVCTVSIRGERVEEAEGTCLGERLADGARERAAADLHDDPVELEPARSELPAERLAALDGQAVEVALAGERDRAVGERRLEGVHGRVAGNPFAPLDTS